MPHAENSNEKLCSQNIKKSEILAQKVRKQLKKDLEHYIGHFKDPIIAVNSISKNSELNVKTIKRLLKGENTPTHHTLLRIYMVLTGTTDENKFFEMIPPCIREYIGDCSTYNVVNLNTKTTELLETLKKDPVMAEIFILAGNGPVDKNVLLYRYGQYGMKLVEKLENANILRKSCKQSYSLSPQVPNLTGDLLKYFGQYFVEKFLKIENCDTKEKNMVAFFTEKLTPEGYKEWLKVDTEAFYKKAEIAKDPNYQGDCIYFTFQATDSFK